MINFIFKKKSDYTWKTDRIALRNGTELFLEATKTSIDEWDSCIIKARGMYVYIVFRISGNSLEDICLQWQCNTNPLYTDFNLDKIDKDGFSVSYEDDKEPEELAQEICASLEKTKETFQQLTNQLSLPKVQVPKKFKFNSI